MKYLFLFAFTIAIASFPLNAKPTLDFPLDKPYPKTHRLSKIKTIEPFWVLPKNSDVDDLIKKQSPIRNQAARGTCSIFSATALLESLLLIEGNTTQIDLAEEFLEYIAARTRTVDGSTSDANIRNFQSYGMPNENTMPYIGQTWKTLGFSSLSQDRCGKVSSYYLDSCLLAHYDPNLLFASENSLKDPKGSLFNPDFLKARQEAEHFRDTELKSPEWERVSDDQFIYRVSKEELCEAVLSVTGSYDIPPRLLLSCDPVPLNSDGLHDPKYALVLSTKAAEFLCDHSRLVLFGTSWKSADFQPGSRERPVHKALLRKGAILELLDLSNVKPGKYFMVAMPIPLVGASEAPVCPVLFVKDDLLL
jgi:hypothetical protein